MPTKSTFLKLLTTVALIYPHDTTLAQNGSGAIADASPSLSVRHRAAEQGDLAPLIDCFRDSSRSATISPAVAS
jgi:hypothetical protein